MNTAIAIKFPMSNTIIFQGKKPISRKTRRQSLTAHHTAVDPIKSQEHITQIIQYFLTHKDNKNYTWLRNAMLFIVGCNFSFRVSDLCRLQAKHILNPDNTFKTHVTVKAQKTGKIHHIGINDSVKAVVTKYYNTLKTWPNQNDYLFTSAKGAHLTGDAVHEIIVLAGKELSLPYNLGSHSLRKTFGYWTIKNNQNNAHIINELQDMLGHNNQRDTLRYIGLDQETKDEIVLGLNIGLEAIME